MTENQPTPSQLSEGEYRVGLDFNPSGDPLVNEIKLRAAQLIDMMLNHAAGTTGVGAREANIAAHEFEEGAMWAVKAITKKPRLNNVPDKPAEYQE